MKKRKELDALVTHLKNGGSKKMGYHLKRGSHELLRHESDSSDMEDFSILQPRRKSRKKRTGRFCFTAVCLSLCQFILVTTSCLVTASLVWLHIGLREDLDLLRTHIQKVEASNRNTPEAFHVIHSNLRQLDSNVSMLYIDIRKNSVEIENITSEMKLLKDVANSLKDSIAAAPAIQQLPKDMHALSESVAGFGSKMNALESNVKELKDQQSNLQTLTQNLSGELDTVKVSVQELSNSSEVQSKSSVNSPMRDMPIQNSMLEVKQQVTFLQGQLSNVLITLNNFNSTLWKESNQCNELRSKMDTVQDAVMFLNNDTLLQKTRLASLENFILFNLSMRLEQMDSSSSSSQKPSSEDIQNQLNKTISQVILQLSDKVIAHGNSPVNTTVNAIRQTHDYLVLLSALLEKIEQIPDGISYDNATAGVDTMLQLSFQKMLLPTYNKIQAIEKSVQDLSAFVASNHSPETTQSRDNSLEKVITVPSENLSTEPKADRQAQSEVLPFH